jgi:hypothetical protein
LNVIQVANGINALINATQAIYISGDLNPIADDPATPVVNYRDTLADSGASAHFTPFMEDLSDIQEISVQAILADGIATTATREGTMYVKFECITTRKNYVVPFPNTICLPSLQYRILSVATMAAQGHNEF